MVGAVFMTWTALVSRDAMTAYGSSRRAAGRTRRPDGLGQHAYRTSKATSDTSP